MIGRPVPDEYAPYFGRYVSLVAGDDLFAVLASESAATEKFLGAITEEQSRHRYAPGKWSIRQILCHVVDAERIFGCRALRIGRGDPTPLTGFEQDDLMPGSGADDRSWADLVADHDAVRAATLTLLRGFPPEAFDRAGTAGGNRFTPRALGWIIVGHEIHHRNVIRDRYRS